MMSYNSNETSNDFQPLWNITGLLVDVKLPGHKSTYGWNIVHMNKRKQESCQNPLALG